MNTIQQISGTLTNFLIATNRYGPTALFSAITAIGFGRAAYQLPKIKKSSTDLDAPTQKIFNEILSECGLKEGSISCKIFPDYASEAKSLTSRLLTIAPSTAQDLVGSERKKALLARAIIKHEIGHCYHHHLIARIAKCAGVLCTVYWLNKLLEQYVLVPLTSYSPLLGIIGSVFTTYIQLKCLYKTMLRIRRHEETQADAFLIQHAKSKEELQASAEKFHEDFEKHLKLIKFLNVSFGKSPYQLFKNRTNKKQSLEDWAIENRHLPNVGGESPIHPPLYDRAVTFRKAAEAFR